LRQHQADAAAAEHDQLAGQSIESSASTWPCARRRICRPRRCRAPAPRNALVFVIRLSRHRTSGPG
jgi:hypothetical protein